MCLIIDNVSALERASKVNELKECSLCECFIHPDKMSKENPSVCEDCFAESKQID